MEPVMNGPRVAAGITSVLALWCFASCSRTPSIDWSAKENFFALEKSEETDDGARLEFHTLVDAPAQAVYNALADVENYSTFVDGVSESSLVSSEGGAKVIQITQTVIGRQSRAKVKWILHPAEMQIEFETLQSDANYNDGKYTIISSPDGKRSYVISVYHVKWKGAPQNVPLGVLKTATRESYEKAARSVKQRALSKSG
jgi:hypothetical protein